MIIGNDEIQSGIYKIKDMQKKEEYSLKIDELEEYLNK